MQSCISSLYSSTCKVKSNTPKSFLMMFEAAFIIAIGFSPLAGKRGEIIIIKKTNFNTTNRTLRHYYRDTKNIAKLKGGGNCKLLPSPLDCKASLDSLAVLQPKHALFGDINR